jgi:hypothetical protein
VSRLKRKSAEALYTGSMHPYLSLFTKSNLWNKRGDCQQMNG